MLIGIHAVAYFCFFHLGLGCMILQHVAYISRTQHCTHIKSPRVPGFDGILQLISLSILILDIVIHHLPYQEVFSFAE
jgi:hypothetical protein